MSDGESSEHTSFASLAGDVSEPEGVWRPGSVSELADAWNEMSRNGGPQPVAVGGREHLRAERIPSNWRAVETTGCNDVISVDRESGLVRVEAGIRWGELREQLRQRDLGTEMLRLQPVSATIGGLLGRYRRFEPQFERGDLREACAGLTTAGGYTYSDAPRKASGPDLRYTAIGGESREALIVAVTLAVTTPPASRLLEIDAPDAGTAVDGWRTLSEIGARLGWAWWRRSEGVLWCAAHGPERFLKALDRRLDEASIEVNIEGESAVDQRRSALESQHPDRRILSRGDSVWAVTLAMGELEKAFAETPGDDVVIADWGPHRVTAWVSGHDVSSDERISKHALGARRVDDGRVMSSQAQETENTGESDD